MLLFFDGLYNVPFNMKNESTIMKVQQNGSWLMPIKKQGNDKEQDRNELNRYKSVLQAHSFSIN
jgi:hypothetical protein